MGCSAEMLAYKFKGAAQADHIFDILLNQRLFCAPSAILNDPMEGIFAYSYQGEGEASSAKDLASAVSKALQPLRVCSLSETFDTHLLWAHYAAGFNGVAIEVELPDNDERIRSVSYRGVFGYFGYAPDTCALSTAKDILFSKYQEWSYEREIRIVSNDEWFLLETPVRKLIAGPRLHPALFDALQIICERQGVDFCRVGIGDEGIDADYVEPFAARKKRQST